MGCILNSKPSFELKCSNCLGWDKNSLSDSNLNLEKKKGVNLNESVRNHVTDNYTKINLEDNLEETGENHKKFNIISKNVYSIHL